MKALTPGVWPEQVEGYGRNQKAGKVGERTCRG